MGCESIKEIGQRNQGPGEGTLCGLRVYQGDRATCQGAGVHKYMARLAGKRQHTEAQN